MTLMAGRAVPSIPFVNTSPYQREGKADGLMTMIPAPKALGLWLAVALVAVLPRAAEAQETDVPDVYAPEWESLTQHPTPAWFRDAKFGIYFHWGPYSVPAYRNEWYSHWMYMPGEHWGADYRAYHEATYGPLTTFGYKDFIPMFKAERFDPAAWAALFRRAGARFAGPVTEHADGFAMWDSKLTAWDAAEKGPQRDVVGELEEAIRSEGLKFITTLHHHWNWGWFPTWDETTDAANPAYADFYGPKLPATAFPGGLENPEPFPDSAFVALWLSKTLEVIDRYHPDLLWFDNRAFIIPADVRREMLAHYYNQAAARGQEVTMIYKNEDFAEGAGVVDLERGRMDHLTSFPWMTDDSIDWNAWSDIQDPNYKGTDRLIDGLIDIVSKNGTLLLNITPRADGTILEGVQERLIEMGAWLDVNGEAIYGTRPWKIYGEGPTAVAAGHFQERNIGAFTAQDFRFTLCACTQTPKTSSFPRRQKAKLHDSTSSKGRLQTGFPPPRSEG